MKVSLVTVGACGIDWAIAERLPDDGPRGAILDVEPAPERREHGTVLLCQPIASPCRR